MSKIAQQIKKHIAPKLMKEFSLDNILAAPKVKKIVLNVGVRSDTKDAKAIEDYIKDLKAITGQSPVKTLAKKSVSSFNIREGQVVGLMVTLRGKRMYDFLEKLIMATLPRVRDFRGLDMKGFDKNGNYSIGLRDQLAFGEISADSVGHTFGMQVTITIDAKSRDQAIAFMKELGLPLKK